MMTGYVLLGLLAAVILVGNLIFILYAVLHRKDPDEGLALRPEVRQRLVDAAAADPSELRTLEDMMAEIDDKEEAGVTTSR